MSKQKDKEKYQLNIKTYNMKTIHIKDVEGVKFNGGTSFRTVLAKDNLGFAMMETRIDKGGTYKWHYKNHQEACMCISGEGMITDLSDGIDSRIYPGVTYLVDDHQPHLFTAITDVVLVSVFNPALTGLETHDEDGSYNLDLADTIVTAISNCANDYDAKDKVVEILNNK